MTLLTVLFVIEAGIILSAIALVSSLSLYLRSFNQVDDFDKRDRP